MRARQRRHRAATRAARRAADDPAARGRAHAGVDLVVVGPEAPLVAGLRRRADAAACRCFGPVAAAARLEGSKAYAKEVMAAAGVPTAAHDVVTTSRRAWPRSPATRR